MNKPIVLLSTGYTGEERSVKLAPFYARAVEAAGGIPLIAAGAPPEEYAMLADVLILTGGEDVEPRRYGQKPQTDTLACDPTRDEVEFELLRAFAAVRKPVLGICRGMQLLIAAYGGKLYQHLPDVLSGPHSEEREGIPVHEVRTVPGTRLAEILPETFLVNSYHHQGGDRMANGIRAAAFSEDGVPEAMEHTSLPIFGVQWHPERMLDNPMFPDMLPLFRFVFSLAER